MKPEQLKAYKDQLLRLDRRLETSLEGLENEIAVSGMAIGETDPFTQRSMEVELEVEKAEEDIQHLVKAALIRLEHGTFGTCDDCGHKIAKARLDAIPYTPFCITCETKRENC